MKALVPDPLKERWREFRWRYRWLRWMPGTSRLFGPPRRWVRLAQYLEKHPGSYREVLPAHHLAAPNIRCIGAVHERFFSRMQRSIPAAGVVELPRVRLLGPDGWIVGARDSLILDTSYHAYWDSGMSADGHWILRRRRPKPVRQLAGRTLSLASDFTAGGFAHFVHDSLCRLLLLEHAGIDPTEFDQIYWPHLRATGAARLVASSGIPLEKLVTDDRRYDFECESLTATTFPGRPAHITPPYCEFLRRKFAPAPLGAGRRIYLSRRGFKRSVENAPEVERILSARGYEICEPHLDPDILAKCAAATHIVSLEGSGFYNAFAAPPGTRSLIILPEAGQTLPYNPVLAASAGHRVYLMMARSLDEPDREAANVHIEPAMLFKALDAMDEPA